MNVEMWLSTLKIFAPEFNQLKEKDEELIVEGEIKLPITNVNDILFIANKEAKSIFEKQSKYSFRVVGEKAILTASIAKANETLLTYAKKNVIEDPRVIEKVLSLGADETATGFKVPFKAGLAYSSGKWVLYLEEKDIDYLEGFKEPYKHIGTKLVLTFKENKFCKDLSVTKNKTESIAKLSDTYKDDISWDILYNISEEFTKYLYQFSISKLNIFKLKDDVYEVYVKTVGDNRPIVKLPAGWIMTEATSSELKFRSTKSVCNSKLKAVMTYMLA